MCVQALLIDGRSAVRGFAVLLTAALVALGSPEGAGQLGAQVPAGVPSPSEFHGYQLGTKFTSSMGLYAYYKELAARSARVDYREYGRSQGGYPLPMLLISSENNLAAAVRIEGANQRLTRGTEPLADVELEALVSNTPATVWLHVVDTTELGGTEVMQQVAYDLATRDDAEAREIREQVLVIIAPFANPDSHTRFTSWFTVYDVEGAWLDPNGLAGRPPWALGADANAYGIDLFRDFAWFTTPETRGLAGELVRWRPQFVLDIHSGPPVFYMSPHDPPYHPLWPEQVHKWQRAVAQEAAKRFGVKGWSLFTRSDFTGQIHAGAGRSWTTLGISTGSFLYETISVDRARVRSDGSVATLQMAMERHYEAIWSALHVASQRKKELMRDQHRIFVEAVKAVRTAAVRGVVLSAEVPGVDPAKVDRLVQRLVLQGIEVHEASRPFEAQVGDFFDGGVKTTRRFPAGTFVVDFDQPQARLARALLDPTLDYTNPHVRLPAEYEALFRDVTWSNLPYLFGVRAYALDAPPRVEGAVTDGSGKRRGSYTALDRSGPPYAYLLPAGLESSYRVSIRLMAEGYRLRVFHYPLRIGDRRYAKGTWAAIRARNPDGLALRIKPLAEQYDATVVEISSPLTDNGVDFGHDERLAPIPQPTVAVLASFPALFDGGFDGVRSVLEGDFGLPFVPVGLETLHNADLSRYTAIVLPQGRGYRDVLKTENLRRYVEGGGTVIAIHQAAEVLAEDPVLGKDVDAEGRFELLRGAALRAVCGPSIPDAEDPVLWKPGYHVVDRIGVPLLATGYDCTGLAVPAEYAVRLKVSEDTSARVLLQFERDPARVRLDGFIRSEDQADIAGRPFVVLQPAGRGRVIFFADQPTYRAYWYGLNILFLNALLFGPTL